MEMETSKRTKIGFLQTHFASGRSLTQLEAIGLYGAYRLAARVHELKNKGWDITTTIKTDTFGDKYAEYQLAKPKKPRRKRFG